MTLILCACGCEEELDDYDKWHPYKRKRFINGHQSIGRKPTPEARVNMSRGQLGNKNSLGRIYSEETKNKIRDNKPLQTGELNPNWKGGRQLYIFRANIKRRDNFGFIPLNECREDGWVGHHIDKDYVIFIPEKLHKSTYHSVIKNINMDLINDKVYEWFVEYYFGVN